MSKRRKKWEKTWSSSDSEEADEAPIVVSRLKSKRVKATGNTDIKDSSTKNSSIQNNQKVTKSKVEVKDEDPHLLKLRDTIYSPSSNSYYAELPAPRRRAAFFDETDDDESWKKELSQTSNAKEHEPLSLDDKSAIEPVSLFSNNNNNNTNNTFNNEHTLGQGNRIQRAINEVRRVQHKTLSILQADEDSEVDSEDFYIYSSRLNSTLNKSLYNANTVSTNELFGNLEEEDPLVETKKPSEEPRFPFLPYVSSDSDSESDDLRFGAEAMFPDEMENDEDKYYHRKQKNEESEKRQNSDPLKTKQENRDKLIRKCFGTSEMERKQRERSFHGSFSSGMQAFFLNIKDVESLEAQSESPSDVDDALQICLHENNVSIIVIGNEVRATVCSTYTVVLLMSPPMGVMNHRRLLNSVCSCQISNVNNNNLFCKHIVAVLLLSIFRPQKLLSVETIKKKLTSLSREELETILINQFVINPTQWTTFESSLSLVEKNTTLMDLTQPLAITPIQPISEEQQVVLEKQLGHSVNDVDDIKQLIESALQQYEHIGAASGISLDLSLPREEGISLPSKLLGRVLSDDAEKVANQQSPLQVAVKQVVAKSRQRWLACDYNSALLSLLTVSEYMVILYRKQKDFGILGPEHSVHPLYYGYRSHNPYSRKETVMTSLLQILNKVWVEYMISYPLSASSRMQWAEKLAEWGSLFSDAIPLAKNGWEDPNLKEIMNRATIIETTSDVEPQDEEFNVDMETDDRIASLLENVDSSDPESTLLRSVSKYMLTKRAQDRERANLANSNESDQIHPVLKESKEVLLTRIHYLLSKGLFTQSLNLSRSAGVVIGEAMSLIYMNHIQEGVLVALNKVEAVYDLYSLIHILKEHCPFGVFEIGTKLLKLLATRPKNTPDDAPYWKRAETEISATLTHNGKDIQLTPVSLAEFMIHYAHQKSHASEEPPVTTEKEGSTSMELEKAKLANVDSLTRLCARKVAIAYIEEPPHERFELLSSLAPELQSLIMIELLSLKLPDVLPSKDLTHCAKLFNKLGEYQVCFHLLVKSISAPPGSSDSSKVVLSNPIASDTLMWAADLACSFPGEREAFALAKELNKQATKSNLFRIAHAVGLSTYMLPGSCRGPTNVLNAKQLFDVARIFYRSKKYQASLAAAAGCFRVRRTYRYSYTIHSQDADKLQVLAWIIVRLLPVVDKREDPIKTIVTQLLSSKVPSTMLYFVHYLLEMNKMEEDPECIVQHKQQIQQLIERSLRCKKGIGRNFFELAQELHRHGDKVNALKLAIKSYGLRGFFQTSMPLPYGRERSETAVTPKNAYDWVLVHLEQLTDEELEQVCESRKFILSERTLAFAVAKILEKRQFVDIAAEIALRSLDIPHTMMSTRPASSLGEIVAWLLVLLSEHPEVTESTRTRVKLLEPEALEKKCEELLNSSDCFVVSRNLYELGNKAGAFKLGQRALACSPRSIEIAEWLGTLAVELGQPVTAQITALVLFQEKPSLAHYKLLKERGVPSEKIEFLLMKVSKSTKDIGILEVLLQKLMWDDAFAFVDRFECNPKALKFLFEKLETSNNNNNNKNSTKLSISNSLRKELLQRCIQRLETFLFSFHWQNQGDIEENVFIMQELLPKYAPDLIEYFNCIQVVSRSINTLSASNAQYVRLITELESLYKILEKGGKYHVWRDIVDYVKAKHKLKKKLISMMNVKNW